MAWLEGPSVVYPSDVITPDLVFRPIWIGLVEIQGPRVEAYGFRHPSTCTSLGRAQDDIAVLNRELAIAFPDVLFCALVCDKLFDADSSPPISNLNLLLDGGVVEMVEVPLRLYGEGIEPEVIDLGHLSLPSENETPSTTVSLFDQRGTLLPIEEGHVFLEDTVGFIMVPVASGRAVDLPSGRHELRFSSPWLARERLSFTAPGASSIFLEGVYRECRITVRDPWGEPCHHYSMTIRAGEKHSTHYRDVGTPPLEVWLPEGHAHIVGETVDHGRFAKTIIVEGSLTAEPLDVYIEL